MSNAILRRLRPIAAVVVCACSGPTMTPPSGGTADPGTVVVLSVVPSSGAVNVDPSAPVIISFNHAMMTGMELLVMLHEGSVAGAEVPGVATWSSDRRTLTFSPAQPLKSKATYVLHLSPNLKDVNGQAINLAWCAQYLGGQAAANWTMGGMMQNRLMMGAGWQPVSGPWGYGMIFMFATA